MKKILLILLLFVTGNVAFSQDFDIKKNVVYIDGKECLKFHVSDPNNVSLLDMDGHEIIFMKYIHNTPYATVYNKITFLDQKMSFTSKDYIYTKKLLIKRLLNEGIIKDCKLNVEKVESFVMKFDENVERL
jgi:hypothetical protein